MNVDWTQITISTMTTGLGFGLVIAPISTTAIKAVRSTQAGMGAAIITSLRMVGMMLGLAALTSWALAYFKQLASQFPSLPTTATSDQFAQWSKNYANHLISSAHSVYSAVFFATMILTLIAIVPAIFLWGNKASIEELAAANEPLEVTPQEIDTHEDDTIPIAAGTAGAFLAASDTLDTPYAGTTPPLPPVDENSGNSGNGNNKPKNRRRLLIAIASIAVVLLLVLGGVFAAFLWQPGSDTTGNSSNSGTGSAQAPTATPVSGPRMIELAMDQTAMTSLFTSQLGLNQGTITGMQVTPVQGDDVVLTLNLNINASGIHRVMPIELDSTIGVNQQQNIALHVLHLKRDGLDAGPSAAARMEQALNQLLLSSLMPTLHNQLKHAQIISVHTSSSIVCGKGTEMLVLLIKAPPIEGIAAQPTPTALCFKGPIDLNKLIPG